MNETNTHKEEDKESERKTRKDDVNDHKNTKSSLLPLVNVFFSSDELHRESARNAPNLPPELPMSFILRYVLK
jgi:hypothetical protein